MDKKYSRRDLAKVLGATTGVVILGKTLPQSWKKPAIDVVTLPAHADMSPKKKGSGSGSASSS